MNTLEEMSRLQIRVRKLEDLDRKLIPEWANYLVTTCTGDILISKDTPVFDDDARAWKATGAFILNKEGDLRKDGDLFNVGWMVEGTRPLWSSELFNIGISSFSTDGKTEVTDTATPCYKPFDLLRHYKGGVYTIITSCKIEATGEVSYAYRGTDGEVWVRPKKEVEDPNRFTPIKL